MIIIEKVETCGWEPALRGMRNPKNSWDRADSVFDKSNPWCFGSLHNEVSACIGNNDLKLATDLAKGGPVHAKYRRMIDVYLDITAPLYWWKEFDTYKVGTVANSCSTMHKIHAKEFTIDDFSHEHLSETNINLLEMIVRNLNTARRSYVEASDSDEAKEYWWQMIQLLPSSYNQKRTVKLNYEVLTNIYHSPRHNHKLDEWRIFCQWIRTLPYAEYLIIDPHKLDWDNEHTVVSSNC